MSFGESFASLQRLLHRLHRAVQQNRPSIARGRVRVNFFLQVESGRSAPRRDEGKIDFCPPSFAKSSIFAFFPAASFQTFATPMRSLLKSMLFAFLKPSMSQSTIL